MTPYQDVVCHNGMDHGEVQWGGLQYFQAGNGQIPGSILTSSNFVIFLKNHFQFELRVSCL